MAKVKFGLSKHELGREEKAVVFEAHETKGGKIGELHISRGGLRWYPANSQKSHHFGNWKDFATLMEAHMPKTK